MLSVQPFEALYIVIILTAFLLTISAVIDARADRAAVRLLNGHARELAAEGNIRREQLRLVILAFLFVIVIPGLFDDSEIPISPLIIALLGIPVVLLISTVFDAKDRRAMTILVTADLVKKQDTTLNRIEDKLDKNTEISQGARDDAHEAAEVANNVNLKIADLNEALVSQGVDRARELATEVGTQQAVISTIDDTHSKVEDLHDQLPAIGET